MTKITIYNPDAEIIEAICEKNDVTEAEIIEAFMEYLDEVKKDNGWR